MKNQSYNHQFFNEGGFGGFSAITKLDFPVYKLGDVIKYFRTEEEMSDVTTPDLFFIVDSSIVEITFPEDETFGTYSWRSSFVSLNQNNKARELGLDDYKPEDDPQYNQVAE